MTEPTWRDVARTVVPVPDDDLQRARDLADDDIATVRDLRYVLAELDRRKERFAEELRVLLRGHHGEIERLTAERDQARTVAEHYRAMRCSKCGRKVAHVDAAGAVFGLGCARGAECPGDGVEEWAIRQWHRPGGPGYYDSYTTAETAEADLAMSVDYLDEAAADGRGAPRADTAIVKRRVWSTDWETVKTIPAAEVKACANPGCGHPVAEHGRRGCQVTTGRRNDLGNAIYCPCRRDYQGGQR